jgi:hypothetical protein
MISNFQELAEHTNHKLEVAIYGDNQNAAIECVNCFCILLDYENQQLEEKESNK